MRAAVIEPVTFVRCLRGRHALYAVLGLQLAAFWPVWRWYAARMTDGSDEPWGILALITALGHALSSRRQTRDFSIPVPAVVFGILYAGCYSYVPPLVSATLAVLSVGSLASRIVSGKAVDPGLCGLLLLSLPIIATLQFYLGYPLRALTASVTASMLRLVHVPVTSAGTVLDIAGLKIWVDAPCSGIKMLWMASYLCCFLVCRRGLTQPAAIVLSCAASLLVFSANCVRSAFLLFLELIAPLTADILHTGIGALCFTSTAVLVIALGRKLPSAPMDAPQSRTTRPIILPVFLLVLLTAGCVSVFDKPKMNRAFDAAHWPGELDGIKLTEIPISERERRFEEDFPGEIKRFTAGRREVIVRAIYQPSRKLHSSSDCLRAVGYTIRAADSELSVDGQRGCFTAHRGGERLKVCEYIEAADGGSYPDVSSWYWGAVWGKSKGPWMAYTISEPI